MGQKCPVKFCMVLKNHTACYRIMILETREKEVWQVWNLKN